MNNNENNQFNNFNNNGQPNINNQQSYSNNQNTGVPNTNNNFTGYNQMPNPGQNMNIGPIPQPQSQQVQPTMNSQFGINNQPIPVNQPTMNVNSMPSNNINLNNQVPNLTNNIPNSNQQVPNMSAQPLNPNQFVTTPNPTNIVTPEPTPIQPQPIMNNQFMGNPQTNVTNPNMINGINNNINPNLNNNINNMSNPNMNSGMNTINNQPPQNNPTNNYNNIVNNKKPKKKSNPIIVILLLIVIVGCIAWTIYYLSSQGYINLGFNNEQENTQDSTTIKLDDTKDYVYDATYQLETTVDEYELSDGTKINKSDITVPYININSNDAVNANKELNNLYSSLIDSFNKNSTDKTSYEIVNYLSSITDNVLSVAVEVKSYSMVPTYDYYTYNFDLTTGNSLDYETLLSNFSYTTDDVDNYVSETLKNYLENSCNGDQTCLDEYETQYNTSLESYNQKVTDTTLNFFMDNYNLYIVLNPSDGSQNAGSNVLFNVISKESTTIESK
jgi:hypothetical protein